MSLKKTAAIATAVGVMAAISVPAMAMENEIHGMYKLKYIVSDADNGGASYITPNTSNEKLKANNFFEQRARLFYTAKANDDLKLVTGFEIDSVFGDKAQGSITPANVASGALTYRNSGGALESDAVNLETKHVYLDFKIPSTPTRVTAGIQPIKDALKGVFFDADVAGVNTVSKVGPATIGLGYFRAYDQSFFMTTNTPPKGMNNLDIVALNADVNLNKNLKVGAAYYLYSDNRDNTPTKLHTFGVNADAKFGPLGVSGFAAMQQGVKGGSSTVAHTVYTGYAFNGAAKLAIGPGALRTALLFTSGDDGKDGINTAWQSVNQSLNAPSTGLNGTAPATNSYNDSNMMLLNRSVNMGGTSTDRAIIYDTNNKDQGVWLASIGYDANITPKTYASANVGCAWVAKQNAIKPVDKATGAANGSNFQGTEINLETGYKMYDNLTASVQAAYVILGGYYKGSAANSSASAVKDPENPYTARVVLSYAF